LEYDIYTCGIYKGGITIQKSQPSRTAQSVATNILLLSQDPVFCKLIVPEAVAPTRWFLEAFPGLGGKFFQLFDLPMIRTSLQFIENLTLPGLSIHIALRKRWIEEQTVSAFRNGCTQVVILGAGFDTLAYRLHRQFSQVRWWEIDHPATQQVKRQALDQHDGIAANLILTPVDFEEQTLTYTLQQLPDYNRQAATLFIAEGLLMYLSETEVKELLQAIYENSGSGSSLIGTLLKPAPDGGLTIPGASRLVDLRLQLMGEPYRWGLAPTAMPAFFKTHGFQPLEIINAQKIISQYLSGKDVEVPLPEGEYFFRAERMNHLE
jgi:methyltransferase (TIGR00027 family)